MDGMDKKIYYFITTVEEGSFSAAARKLYLSQSALSQQIAVLESELSNKLFDRTGYRPVLTGAGRLFYEGCKDIMGQYEQIKEQVKNLASHDIRIGFSGVSENKYLLGSVKYLKKENSGLSVSVKNGTTKECIHNLRNGSLDISFGLESDYKGLEGITYQALFDYDMCLACSYDHPLAGEDWVSIAQLEGEDFILLSKEFGEGFFKEFKQACKEDGFKMNVRKYVDTFDELMFAVSVGEGVAILSRDVVDEKEVAAIPLKDTHHNNRYVIAYKKDLRETIQKEFVDKIVHYFETL